MVWPQIQVGIASLVVGVAAGWIMHRADFCAVAALRDSFMFGDTGMFRAQALLVALSVVLFEALRLSGVQSYSATPFYGLPSWTNVIGGCLFGFGMVLAGGCVVGVLYRLGSGSRLALTALVGLLCGSAVYAEIHPWWRTLAAKMVLGDVATLPRLSGIPTPVWAVLMLVLAVWLWRGLAVTSVREQASGLRGYLAPHHAAIGLALCGVVSLLLVGMPMGVTTSYAKIAAFAERTLVPQHVAALEFFSRQPLLYTPPYSEIQIAGGGGADLDALALIQFPLIGGLLAGAAISAWRLREFRVRFSPPRLQVLVAFSGGGIMGLASRLTPGCNVWHVWGGLPHLALSSMLFFIALLPGAWFGTRVIQLVILNSQREGTQ